MLFLLKNVYDVTGTQSYIWPLAQNKGAVLLSKRMDFDTLAAKANTLDLSGVRELKFIMTDLNSNNPVLFFMNSNTTPLHYNFVRNILNRYQNISYDSGLAQFNTETYFRNRRNYLVGSVVAYDNYNDGDNLGIYALEFWPTDPVRQTNRTSLSYAECRHAIFA